MTPLAMEGTAPMRMTNRIACSESWNSRIARGNHAIEGMVCSPVIIDPIAARRILERETATPRTSPTTVAMRKPTTPRVKVMATACQSWPLPTCAASSANTGPGPGSTYDGFHPDSTTACHTARAMATAATLGHSHAHTARERPGASWPVSRASSPLISDSCSVSSAMAGHLLAQRGR